MRTWSLYFQSERWDWKAARMSSRDDCRCWRMRGSNFDELLMCLCNLVSMRLMNRELEWRMVNELSESPGWRLGHQDRTSGPVRRRPEMWMILRLKSTRLSNHHAWWQLRFWA